MSDGYTMTDDLIAIVADRVREELRNIHDAWRAGVI